MEENTENTESENTQNEPPHPAEPNTEKKAPWEESGEEFNAEKAWNLIQNLRSDRESLKKERDAAAGKVKSIEDEKLTELERTQRDLEETRAQFTELTQANALNTALADHPELSKEDFDLIKGSTPEEVADKAAKLAARYASQAQAQAKNNNPVAALNPLLRADPRGGIDPGSSKSRDPFRDLLNNN